MYGIMQKKTKAEEKRKKKLLTERKEADNEKKKIACAVGFQYFAVELCFTAQLLDE